LADIRLGGLRWPVQIALRTDVAASGGGMSQTYTAVTTAYADIQPLRGGVYIGLQQIGNDSTHTITMRWQPQLSTFHVIVRTTTNPDGSPLIEVYRVNRVLPIDGRKRFVSAEVTLESTPTVTPIG
jgi:head-tail adaptor